MKKIKYFLLMLVSLLSGIGSVYAASINISLTSKTVTKGNSVTVTAKISSSNSLYFTEGKLVCSGAGVNASKSLVDDSMNDKVYNKSFSLSIKPTAAGTVTCTTSGVRITDSSSGSWQNLDNKSVKITVNNPVVAPPKVYSSNSYLSSLTVDGYTLDNKFDKETLEYSVTVKEGTEKIKVNAQLADSSAKVSGIGTLTVTEGLNTLNIVVTAENGSKRTYVLKVNVKEYAPINVTVLDNEYTVVRKRKDLGEISEYFTEKDITIGEDIVEGYYSEKLDYSVVGLKDKFGNIEFYIYQDGEYTLYNEQVFNGTVLRILDKDTPKGYKKTSFSYNDTEINSYQEVKLDIIKNTYALDNNDIHGNDFYLFYAVNMETGKEELYQYDAVEKTVQRYNTLILDMYKETSDTYYLYLLCSILVLGVVIITFSTIIICGKQKKKRLNKKKKVNNNKRKSIDKELELD